MKFEFDTIEEILEFTKKLKGTRGGKADKEEAETASAPAPLAPPVTTQTFNPGNVAGFAPPAAGATAGAAGPFAAGAAGPAPEVLALVTRINARIDGAIASGQPAAQVLDWFQKQCGPEAAAFTMEQIKALALPKLSVPQLEAVAKLMNA